MVKIIEEDLTLLIIGEAFLSTPIRRKLSGQIEAARLVCRSQLYSKVSAMLLR